MSGIGSPIQAQQAARQRRSFVVPTALVLAPPLVALAATAWLIAFPHEPLAWQAGAWTLAVALLVLPVVVPATAWSLLHHPGARRWPRIIGFSLGTAWLAALAAGMLL